MSTKIGSTDPKVLHLYREQEIDVADGQAWLYRVEKEQVSGFSGYDSHFIIHEVEETRYTHDAKPLRADTNTRYHAWQAIEQDGEWKAHSVRNEDIPAPNADEAAKKFMRRSDYVQ